MGGPAAVAQALDDVASVERRLERRDPAGTPASRGRRARGRPSLARSDLARAGRSVTAAPVAFRLEFGAKPGMTPGDGQPPGGIRLVAKILEGDLKPERGDAQMFFRKDRFSFRNPDPGTGDGTDKYVHYRLERCRRTALDFRGAQRRGGGKRGGLRWCSGRPVGRAPCGCGACRLTGSWSRRIRLGSGSEPSREGSTLGFGRPDDEGRVRDRVPRWQTCSSRDDSKGLERAGQCP